MLSRQGQQGETSCREVKRSWCPPGGHLAHCVDALKIRNKTKYPSQPVSFLEPFYLHQGSEASKGRQASGGQEGGTGVVFASEDRGEQLLKGELSRSIVFVMRIDTNKGFPTKHTHSPVLTAYPLEGRAWCTGPWRHSKSFLLDRHLLLRPGSSLFQGLEGRVLLTYQQSCGNSCIDVLC